MALEPWPVLWVNHRLLGHVFARVPHAQILFRERELFNAVLAVVTDADLSGIIDDDDPRGAERYAPIVGTILPRLVGELPCAAIQTIIVEEMTFWFNTPPGGSVVGAPERYTRVAQQIWEIWTIHLQGQ
jgi:hypothetical protein